MGTYIDFYFISLDILMLSEKRSGTDFLGVLPGSPLGALGPTLGRLWDCLGRLRATFWLHWAEGVMKIMKKY